MSEQNQIKLPANGLDASLLIEKLDVKDGCFIKLAGSMSCREVEEIMSGIFQFLKKMGIKNVGIVYLPRGKDMALLNEDYMRKCGWVRLNAPTPEESGIPA